MLSFLFRQAVNQISLRLQDLTHLLCAVSPVSAHTSVHLQCCSPQSCVSAHRTEVAQSSKLVIHYLGTDTCMCSSDVARYSHTWDCFLDILLFHIPQNLFWFLWFYLLIFHQSSSGLNSSALCELSVSVSLSRVVEWEREKHTNKQGFIPCS